MRQRNKGLESRGDGSSPRKGDTCPFRKEERGSEGVYKKTNMRVVENLAGAAFETGYAVIRDRGLAIVGMSPGNSYFRKENIDGLLRYCTGKFSQVRIMIADKPMEHNYRAVGYSPAKAERKARLNGNTLQNHSQTSIDALIEKGSESEVKLIEWKKEIDPHENYQREYSELLERYRTSKLFRREVRDTTRTVLNGKLKEGAEIESAIDEGVHYLLGELAFLSASPKMFGVDRIAYVYHDQWQIYEDFVAGKFTGKVREDLGFVIIN